MAPAPRILLVEDDPDFSSAVRSILERAGYEVSGIARTCSDALELAAQQRPDLAILDLNLEDSIDGVTLGFELSAGGVPIIYLTGDIAVAIGRAYEIASDFLEKPLRPSDLLASIEAILANNPPLRRGKVVTH
ncbi:response regulator [Denitrobaculum tricleocarpae]|uniref:Response regulator n=1 Tax=Denitrobaculum tricleocarpae TaxID=2591009 RepID=A0A545TXD4_9PROT|nr:response regulator [Denitrobaculum tricleocarpae]TQV81879.1 response regulator [Denitrobaculum tricleocarpae]